MSDETNNPYYEQAPGAAQPAEIDPFKFQRLIAEVKASQNLPLGFIGGLVAALLGATIWAIVTVVTDYQIGWMAVGIGFLVGLAIRQFGKGIDRIFGIVGAGLALFGCLAGNLLTIAILISQEETVSLVEVLFFLMTTPAVAIELMSLTFSPIDLLFYGIAIYEGYKFSFRQLSKAELVGIMKGTI